MRIPLRAAAFGAAVLMMVAAADAFTPSNWDGVGGRMKGKLSVRGAGTMKIDGTFEGGGLNVSAETVGLSIPGTSLTTPSGDMVNGAGASLQYPTSRSSSRSANFGTVPEGDYTSTNQFVADTINAIRAGGPPLTLWGKAVSPDDLGEFSTGDLDAAATKAKGSAKGIRNFANMKGGMKVSFAGTLATGTHAGKEFKGQIVFKFDDVE